jgi:disease resistance protein
MKDGKYLCANKGCTTKYFLEEENGDEAWHYHSGEPIFHDLMKGWGCWNKETYDWDDFVKIPTCSVGRHVIKYK